MRSSVTGLQDETIGPVQMKKTTMTTPWWRRILNVVCLSCYRGASRNNSAPSGAEETTVSDVAAATGGVPANDIAVAVEAEEEVRIYNKIRFEFDCFIRT